MKFLPPVSRFLFPLFFLLSATAVIPDAEAQWVRPSFHLEQQRKSDLRHSYRPSIRLVGETGASRQVRSGQSLTFEYYARRGWVSRVEVRSGTRVIKTVSLGASKAGRGRITVRASEIPTRFGKPTFKLWAWQGIRGRQSIHGESVKYTVVTP
ncbi:MAG: hypothetical protein AAGA96_16305 [Verrucomicrobiota bacterium]